MGDVQLVYAGRVRQPVRFARLITSLSAFVDVAFMDFSSEGVSFSSTDGSMTFLLQWHLAPRSSFINLICTSSKPVSIALKLEMLSKCLQHVKIEDAVTLVIQQDVIVVKITSSVKSRTKSYRLVLLNAIQDRIVVPDMTHNTGLLLPGSLFTEIFSALKGFSEKVTISFSTAAVVFESSDANLSAKVELNDEPRGQVHVLCKKPVSRDFKLPSLSTVGKIISVAEVKECLIQLGDDAPLSISLDLGDDIGGIEIFLAPLASVD